MAVSTETSRAFFFVLTSVNYFYIDYMLTVQIDILFVIVNN